MTSGMPRPSRSTRSQLALRRPLRTASCSRPFALDGAPGSLAVAARGSLLATARKSLAVTARGSLVIGSLALIASMLPLPAAAQYKWLAADGKTVYSDVPPPSGGERLREAPAARAPANGSGPDLPYELKTVATKFPVVLYSAPECGPCAEARNHLGARGVPFNEKTVTNAKDFDAFKALGFSSNTFPALVVGRDRTVGFEPGAWNRLLSAAGYPQSSKLPASYKQAQAEPLTQPEARQLTVNVQRDGAGAVADSNAVRGDSNAAAGDANGAAGSDDFARRAAEYPANLQAAARARAAAEQSPSLRF